MSLKKRIVAVAATFVMAVGGSLAVASPAQAAMTDCSAGYLCLWEHYEYTSPMYMLSPSTTCKTVGAAIDNKATSLYNRSSRTVRVYNSSNCTGSYLSYLTNQSDWNLRYGPQGTNWNDCISSYRWA